MGTLEETQDSEHWAWRMDRPPPCVASLPATVQQAGKEARRPPSSGHCVPTGLGILSETLSENLRYQAPV